GHALPLLIPRHRCRLNLQTAFLIARRLQARGGRSKIPEPSFPTIPQSRNPSDNTAILKPVIPAQAEIRTPDAAGIYRK
ncbi:TPA: hypothetical protein ACFJJB_002034, partial [Neisseria gonorrhoeae]